MNRRVRDERGASNVELVLYMPLLMLVILMAVQFSLFFMGRQTAETVARETARVVRVTGDADKATETGNRHLRQVGGGVLTDHGIRIEPVGEDRVRVVVTGEAMKIVPLGVPRVRQSVEAPIERFVERQ